MAPTALSGYTTLLVDTADGVTTITLNRPNKRNAMNPTLHLEMRDALEKLAYDDATRALIITGAGEAFCAGMDLKEFFYELKNNPAEHGRIRDIATDWRGRTLRWFPKPVIAMVNGYCFGGGFSIVEGADLAIAAEEATFGLSEVNFKHLPGGSVTKSITNILRPRDALYYALTGRTFDGKRAAEIGFINYAVPLARLREETLSLARELASKDFEALKQTKYLYRGTLNISDWDTAVDYAVAKSAESSLHQNGSWMEQGIGDFLDKKYRPGVESHA
jgi:trans-feruloyl-CoA hydratase/vanillin synthase